MTKSKKKITQSKDKDFRFRDGLLVRGRHNQYTGGSPKRNVIHSDYLDDRRRFLQRQKETNILRGIENIRDQSRNEVALSSTRTTTTGLFS